MAEKNSFSAEEVEHLIENARNQVKLEMLETAFQNFSEVNYKTQAEIFAKLDQLLKDQHIRSEEVSKLAQVLREEMREDFVSKEEFSSMKRSVVWAVGIIVSIGSLISWGLTVLVMVSKLNGGQ